MISINNPHAQRLRFRAAGTVMIGLLLGLGPRAEAVPTGTGTNLFRNVTVTNTLTLGGESRTNWPAGVTNNSVGTVNIVDSAITAAKLTNGAVQGEKLAAAAVSNVNIAANAVTSNKIDWTTMPAGLQDGSVASNWSKYPATLNVNAGGQAVTNIGAAARSLTAASILQWNDAVVVKQGAGTIAAGQVYYYDAAAGGTWTLADASTNTTAQGLLGLALGASVANDGLLVTGVATNSAFTAGDVLYLSTTAGAMAATAPTASNEIVRVVGYAISNTNIVFNPDRTFVELQ